MGQESKLEKGQQVSSGWLQTKRKTSHYLLRNVQSLFRNTLRRCNMLPRNILVTRNIDHLASCIGFGMSVGCMPSTTQFRPVANYCIDSYILQYANIAKGK
jgi:hypothetical protein